MCITWKCDSYNDLSALPIYLTPYQIYSYSEFVYVVERKYLEPSTKIGPDPEEVLEPSILVFESATPIPIGENDVIKEG